MTRLVLLFLVATACTSPDPVGETPVGQGPQGIQVGAEGAFGCVVSSFSAITDPNALIDDLGLSASEALEGLARAFEGTADTWDGVVVDPLDFELADLPALDAMWIETSGPDGEPSSSCTPYLAGSTSASVEAGTVFAAVFDAQVAVSQLGATLVGEVPLDEADGTLVPQFHDPATLDTTSWMLRAEATDDGWAGFVGFSGCGADGACTIMPAAEDAEMVFEVAVP